MYSQEYHQQFINWIITGDYKQVHYCLLNNYVDINAFNKHGESPLSIACSWGHVDIVKLLVNHKFCDIDNQDKLLGDTPLMETCRSAKDKYIDLSTITNDKLATMRKNEYQKYIDIVLILIEAGCDINKQNNYGWTALTYAIEDTRTGIAHILLKNGCNQFLTTSGNNNAISYAKICNASETMIKLLNSFG